jgi:hypothetical protein
VTDPTTPPPLDLRSLFSRKSGALYVQVHAESGQEHRTMVLSPDRVRLFRWIVSPLGVGLAAFFAVTWLVMAVLAARLPSATRRIAELEAESMRVDTLEARLMDLQLRYDQVTRMLSVTTDTSTGPTTGSSR